MSISMVKPFIYVICLPEFRSHSSIYSFNCTNGRVNHIAWVAYKHTLRYYTPHGVIQITYVLADNGDPLRKFMPKIGKLAKYSTYYSNGITNIVRIDSGHTYFPCSILERV